MSKLHSFTAIWMNTFTFDYFHYNPVVKELLKSKQIEMVKHLCNLCKKNDGNFIIKLKKSIYGLRQASKQWHTKLKSVLENSTCIQSSADPCLFIVNYVSNNPMFILIYVDDIIIAGNTMKECKHVVDTL